MPEEVKPENLRPKYKLSRDEILKVVEDLTGQKPKPGAHSVTMTMARDGESGNLTWVDAASRSTAKTGTRAAKPNASNKPTS